MDAHTSATAGSKAQPRTVALFVSDLHLSADVPRTSAAFFDFLQNTGTQAKALYLLGDVFEYWAGDDDLDAPFNQKVCTVLRSLADSGVQIFWIAGNRDFLVGQKFAMAARISLLQEPHIVTMAGQKLLLLHGDAQCIDDTDYMKFRARVRDPAWQSVFLARPLADRKALIAGMREGSRAAQKEKSMAIMDVNPTEIKKLFRSHSVELIIHGHTHRPGMHLTEGGTRYVLPDWDCDGDAVRGGWIAMDSDGKLSSVSILNSG